MGTFYSDTVFDVTEFISLLHILNSVPVFTLKFPNTVEYSCGKCQIEEPPTLGHNRSCAWFLHFYCQLVLSHI
jgi:hypothetical protein